PPPLLGPPGVPPRPPPPPPGGPPGAIQSRARGGPPPATGIDEKGFSADRTVPAAPSPACGRSMQGLPHPGRPQGRDDNA
ncbi:hypothetical protein EJ608_31425, partial [Pseudomonas aeruginosa]